MKTEDIFNANSYTSKAMPVTYELVSKLNYHVFDTVSDEMSELTKKNSAVSRVNSQTVNGVVVAKLSVKSNAQCFYLIGSKIVINRSTRQ